MSLIPTSVLEKCDPVLVNYCKNLETRIEALENFQDCHYTRLYELLIPFRENFNLSDVIDIKAQELDPLESHQYYPNTKVRRFRLATSMSEMKDILNILGQTFGLEPVISFEVLDANEKSDFVYWDESH